MLSGRIDVKYFRVNLFSMLIAGVAAVLACFSVRANEGEARWGQSYDAG
ncbi:uncharacterized protein METZ01_LOCUS426226, partial [marine metagenome]